MSLDKSADQFVASCAKGCYSEFPSYGIIDTISEDQAEKTLTHIISSGHESVVEHLVFTFSVDGISRACSHQLVRHRLASYSQQSQRYVKFRKNEWVMPDTIKNAIESDPNLKDTLDKFEETRSVFYEQLREKGVPDEDIRYAYLGGSTTNITVTMNARTLLNFFKWRCCEQAQWEIRELANHMLAICLEISPVIFQYAGPECVRTGCKEGKRSCGHKYKPNVKLD